VTENYSFRERATKLGIIPQLTKTLSKELMMKCRQCNNAENAENE
jgi:hypothetical protein